MKILGKMRSLDPRIRLYPCFKEKYFQGGMPCNIPYCILKSPLITNYTIKVKSHPLSKDMAILT
jgi:hypothetical protein